MDSLLSIISSPTLSVPVMVVLGITAMYFARPTVHKVIGVTFIGLHRVFRVAYASTRLAEKMLAQRNREVLLAGGREAQERIVEREFDRVNEAINKDLGNFSTLHRALSEAIDRIEKDHADAVDVPPEPPAWVQAVEAIANLDAKDGSIGVGNILSEIHKSLVKAHKEAITAYHKASGERHSLLRKMRPDWRNIQQKLGQLRNHVDNLMSRSVTIDRHMQEYEDIVAGTDRAASVLSSSSLLNFFISGLVLAIAIGGATVNFTLIARPMAEMVGGTNTIGGFRTADIAALVIILVEISMGLFLMESLRITRLFPVISALPDQSRTRMVWITFALLFMLASVEAGLAYMREMLLQDELATSSILRGDATESVTGQFQWITTSAQMGMGFILPFALTFVAIPLETFAHSLRTVIGVVAIGFLRFIATVLRMIANACRYLGRMAQQIYDLPIFFPLWVEKKLGKTGSGSGHTQGFTP